jgi:hypothetical protein
MEYPEIGLSVFAMLDTNEELVGYWDGTIWMQGVDDDGIDIPIVGNVVSWRTWP